MQSHSLLLKVLKKGTMMQAVVSRNLQSDNARLPLQLNLLIARFVCFQPFFEGFHIPTMGGLSVLFVVHLDPVTQQVAVVVGIHESQRRIDVTAALTLFVCEV